MSEVPIMSEETKEEPSVSLPSKSQLRYQKNKEYYKKYYQENRKEWNDYSLKTCECGMVVATLSSHRKTKKHKQFMEILEKTKLSSSLQSVSEA